MRKGTFSVKKATSNSSAHNSRVNPPKYLIGLEAGVKNHYELLENDDDFIAAAKTKYKQTVKQTMQKKQVDNLVLETVLTLKKEQNENDVKNLFAELNKKYGGHELLEVSIHRDEGHFEKDGISYYPTKNILEEDGNWYICSDPNIAKPKIKDYNQKVDISKFEKVYNYHAHAKFSMFDRSLGKSARMNRTQMSERIKFVSNYLGLDYAPGVNRRVAKNVNQIKDEHLAAANTKRLELAKVKDLNAEVKKLKSELTLTQTNHKEIRVFEKELHQKIKDKDLSIEDLQQKVVTLKTELQQNFKDKETVLREFSTLQNQNISLETQKNDLEVKVHDLKEKIVSRPNMEQYEAKIEKIKNTNLEFREIHTYFEMPKEEVTTQRAVFAWIKTKFRELKDRILGLEDENKQLKNELSNANELIATLNLKNKELEKDSLDINPRDKKLIQNINNTCKKENLEFDELLVATYTKVIEKQNFKSRSQETYNGLEL